MSLLMPLIRKFTVRDSINLEGYKCRPALDTVDDATLSWAGDSTMGIYLHGILEKCNALLYNTVNGVEL